MLSEYFTPHAIPLGGGFGSLFLYALVFITLTAFIGAFKRKYFHPLSSIPGPKLAAITSWYDFYYNVIKNGTYSKSFAKLHEQYGSTVIRIAPNEVHVTDPEVLSKIYSVGTEFHKDPALYETNGFYESIFTTTDPKKHRVYRTLFNPYFSMKNADAFGLHVLPECKETARYMLQEANQGKTLDMTDIYRRITADLIYVQIFGKPLGLFTPGYPEVLSCMDLFLEQFHFTRHFPFIKTLASSLPTSVSEKLAPGFIHLRQQLESWIKEFIEQRRTKQNLPNAGNTLLETLLRSNQVKESDTARLIDHTFIFLSAGTDTAGFTMAAATFYILRQPDVLRKLRDEFRGASLFVNGEFQYTRALKLPYLSAVIKEAMRVFPVAPGVLPRVVPEKGVQIGEHFVPGGTIISGSNIVMHYNPTAFENPLAFKPERWLTGAVDERFYSPFSKGTRSCIGMHFANVEMQICLAYLHERFDMELESDAERLELHDLGLGVPAPVHVRITRDRWA